MLVPQMGPNLGEPRASLFKVASWPIMTDVFDRLKASLSDRYTLERELGAGGMATVYLAHDLKHERQVAVKVLRPELAAALGAERFHQEIKIAANLNHPHILPLLDSGESDGFLFFVMPYIEGESLRDKLAHEGELPIAEAVRILRDVVDALTHAHKHNVVHRDIKPDNVMLSDRHALVTDFGVAKAVSEATGRQQLTTEGVALGTPTYMAPEQAAADPHIDHRADIYAVGAVAYELLTGRPPFMGTTPQMILSAHMTDTPEPVTKYRESVPPALAELVMKCLEKKAADRWQSAEELLPQLEALAMPSGGVTPTGTTPVRVTTTRFRSQWPLLVGLSVAAVALSIAGVVWIRSDGPPAPLSEARESVLASRLADERESAREDPVLSLPSGPSIAVIPFANLSADSGDVFFSDGLSEDIVAALSRFSDLFVMSLGATIRYRGQQVEVQQVRDSLGVDYVLQGSVRRSPGRIRVSARLTDAENGESLWSRQFNLDPTAADVFDMQDQITTQVVGAIGGSTGVISRVRIDAVREQQTDDLAAYECVLRAHEYIIDHGPHIHVLALDCLEEAVAIDPGYVEAWGWLAYVYAEVERHGWNRRPDEYDALERALEAAQHAVSLDTGNYMGFFGLAVTYYDMHDLEPFRIAAEKALELNPNDANLLALFGDYISESGDYERGLALLNKSMALNPNHPGWLYSGFFLEQYSGGDYEAALTEVRRFNMPNNYRVPFFQAAALGQLGRLEEASRTLQHLHELRPDLTSVEAVREDLTRYNHPSAMVEHLLDGLRKAGLPQVGAERQ